MIAVFDTSAAVVVVLKKESSALFTDFIAKADLIIVPTLMITKATNVFWKYQKFSEVPMRECLLTCYCHSARRALSRVPETTCFFIRVTLLLQGEVAR